MNANEARELTQKNLRGPLSQPYLDAVHKRIQDAAEQGQSRIVHPFYGISPRPSEEIQAEVLALLRTEGYRVEHHPNPDPGDPRSCEYDEILW